MSTGQTGAGGVRNLRAIYENKATDISSSPPPSRGRSPSGSVGSSHSRPVSKVRTSFVSVERPADLTSVQHRGRRKASDSTMENSSPNGMEAGLGAILKGSAFEPAPGDKRSPVGARNTAQAAGKSPAPEKGKANSIAERAAAMVEKMKQGDSKAPPPPTTKLQTDSTTKPIKPFKSGPIMTGTSKIGSPGEAKKSPVTPTTNGTMIKPRGGVAKIQGVIESSNKAKEARAAAAAAAASNPAAVQAPATTTKEQTAPPKVNKPPRQSLQPKSTTRTSILPSAATATTASSAAKNENEVGQKKEGMVIDKKSTSQGAPRVASATTASSLAKKQSRPSVDTAEKVKPRLSTSRATDEGFLARMMRPTASSAQKAHDKAPVSAPVSAHNHANRTADPKKATAKKPVRRSLAPEKLPDDNKENASPREDVSAGPEVPAETKAEDPIVVSKAVKEQAAATVAERSTAPATS